jgi:hypothetical protein
VLSTVSGLVIVASASIDGARQAAVTMDWLRQNGYQDLLGRSCVVINHVVPGKPNIDVTDLVQQFERHVPPGRVVVLPWDKHIAAGTEIQLELLSRTWRRPCPMTSTGSNVVDLHHRRSYHVERHARSADDHASDDSDRAAHDRPGAAGVGADRDLHRRNRVGARGTPRGHAQGCAGRVRLLGARRVGVRAAWRAAAEGW